MRFWRERGRGGWGCGAEHRQWRMQRGGAPAAVEKIEQASSAMIFSGTARRWGQMRLRLPWERICAQYGFRFFIQEKSKFVSSTASDRKGFVKGESVPLDRVLPTFARTKVGPRRVGVLTTPLQKAPRRRRRSQIRPKNTFFYFSFLPCKKRKSRISATFLCGGDARARTVDLLRVKQAL